jgi:starch phosphorylase
LLTVALLDEQAQSAGRKVFNREDVEAVRGKCVFTTHTPVAAGHDRFPTEMAMYVLGRNELMAMKDVFCFDNAVNMTYLALNLSHYVNGVAKKHGEVSRLIFAGYAIDAITNGVHVPTWTSPAFQMLFDRYIPSRREDSFSLRYALSIPPQEVWAAHSRAKIHLIKFINRETNAGFDMHDLPLGFPRRAASYNAATSFSTMWNGSRASPRGPAGSKSCMVARLIQGTKKGRSSSNGSSGRGMRSDTISK